MEEAKKELKPVPVTQALRDMEAQFRAALPPHVPVEKFVRVVLTAVNGNPELIAADRRSLFESAMKAAQDGLLPDNREAAFVVYNTKAKSGEYIKKVQYLPMVWGIVKKIRQSGELSTITAQVVYDNDDFDYEFGDDEKIYHKPLLKGKRGEPMLAYAIAKTKDGSIYREIMTREEIDAVRSISRAKDAGPWAGPFAYEMWRKTVIRRLSKRLPMSTDLERVIERDDDMYDLDAGRTAIEQPLKVPQAIDEPHGDDEGAQAPAAEEPPANSKESKLQAAERWVKEADEADILAGTELNKLIKGLKQNDQLAICRAFNERRAAIVAQMEKPSGNANAG